MTVKQHTRFIVLSLVVMIVVMGLVLTASHVWHHGTDSTGPATAPIERHCPPASCLMSLPVWVMLSLAILAPIGRACAQALLSCVLVVLPRLDPPPRFTA